MPWSSKVRGEIIKFLEQWQRPFASFGTHIIIKVFLYYFQYIMACLDKLDTLNDLLKKLDIPYDYGYLFNEQIIQLAGFPGLIGCFELLNILYFDKTSQEQCWKAIVDLCYSMITSFIVDISLMNLTRCVKMSRILFCRSALATVAAYTV